MLKSSGLAVGFVGDLRRKGIAPDSEGSFPKVEKSWGPDEGKEVELRI